MSLVLIEATTAWQGLLLKTGFEKGALDPLVHPNVGVVLPAPASAYIVHNIYIYIYVSHRYKCI